MRTRDTEAMMGETVARMVGKRLMYRELVANQGTKDTMAPLYKIPTTRPMASL